MTRARPKAKSIQAERRSRPSKSHAAKLNEKTLKSATRNGMAWETEEVARLVEMIEKDEKTFDMAVSLGRTFYGTANARSHVRFAMNHERAIWGRPR